MGLLDDKTAVITGGTSGIGLATAERFVNEGARVFITGRRQAELDAALQQLGERATGVRGDVGVGADLDRLYATVAETGSGLDVVMANSASVQWRKSATSPKNMWTPW
jgi:NAD(P)-dependent dehydrogenase (short-subunit alcohol dehydrogenase family)